jgi:hypothetical protein
MSLATLKKDPAAKLDYTIDFGGWLAPGETITAAVWSRDPAGLTIGAGAYASSVSADGKRTTVWLESGSAGVTYTVTVNITTSNTPARITERSFRVQVENL